MDAEDLGAEGHSQDRRQCPPHQKTTAPSLPWPGVKPCTQTQRENCSTAALCQENEVTLSQSRKKPGCQTPVQSFASRHNSMRWRTYGIAYLRFKLCNDVGHPFFSELQQKINCLLLLQNASLICNCCSSLHLLLLIINSCNAIKVLKAKSLH